MIYRDSKSSKLKHEDWKITLKTKPLNKSEKENKDKSRSNAKNEQVVSLKKSMNAQKLRFNMTGEIKKEEKKSLLISGDVSSILKAISKNNQIAGTIKPHREAVMTEEDIDKLFGQDPKQSSELKFQRKISSNRIDSKEKFNIASPKNAYSKTDTRLESLKTKSMKFQINELLCDGKDFADSIKFLIQEDTDKMIQALGENGLLPVQIDPHVDKTAKFKQEFVVGKQVGQGAYASVRVAIWTPFNKKVAIKIYEKRKINQPQRRRSVRRQIKILQRVNHPNILKIYDAIETNNHVNLIMEYVSGISLATMLKAQPYNKVTERQARIIFTKLVDAVRYLHHASTCHRDIKLDNILVDSTTLEPKLIDFGFSTCIDNHKKVKMFCGTPSFMAPQIVLKKEYRGSPADIWALGVVLYIMISGSFPFKGSTDKELYDKICSSNYVKPIVSKPLLNLLQAMLTVNADERITADEILNNSWVKNNANRPECTGQHLAVSQIHLYDGLCKKESKQKRFAETYNNEQLLKDCFSKKSSRPGTRTNREACVIQFPKEIVSEKLSNLAYL